MDLHWSKGKNICSVSLSFSHVLFSPSLLFRSNPYKNSKHCYVYLNIFVLHLMQHQMFLITPLCNEEQKHHADRLRFARTPNLASLLLVPYSLHRERKKRLKVLWRILWCCLQKIWNDQLCSAIQRYPERCWILRHCAGVVALGFFFCLCFFTMGGLMWPEC